MTRAGPPTSASCFCRAKPHARPATIDDESWPSRPGDAESNKTEGPLGPVPTVALPLQRAARGVRAGRRRAARSRTAVLRCVLRRGSTGDAGCFSSMRCLSSRPAGPVGTERCACGEMGYSVGKLDEWPRSTHGRRSLNVVLPAGRARKLHSTQSGGPARVVILRTRTRHPSAY